MVGGFILNPFEGAQTMYVDVTVTAPGGIFVSQIDSRAQFGPNGTLDVYRTAVGLTSNTNRTNPSAWRKLTSASVVVANPMVGVLNDIIHLPVGTYGMAFHYVGIQPVYTHPTNPIVVPTVYSNADLTIDCNAGVAQISTAANPFVGGVSAAPRICNLTFTYSLTGHTSDFSLTPASASHPMSVHGNGPILVQFTDESVTSDLTGIFAWAWDFDGVPGTDSVIPNPSFNYTACGDYNVTLTTTDVLGNVSVTRNAIVRINPVTSSFTVAKIGEPAVYQFTDTSTGATGWNWDLDGVPGIDSTLQNPTFSYTPSCTPKTVTLNATNSCRSVPSTQVFTAEPSIVTLFQSNNAPSVGGMVYFEVVVTNPDGITICGLSQNYSGNSGTPVGATVYSKTGTHIGFTTTPGAWTNRGTILGISAPTNTETRLQLATPFYLPAGTHGLAIQATGLAHAYSGTGTSPLPGALTYGNSDVTLNLGTGSNTPFAAGFTPRIWNGRLNYTTVNQGMSAYYKFASGCAGTLGVPGNVGVAAPVLGQNMSVNFTNIPAAGLVFYGFSNTLFQGAIPLPIDLAPLGGPGCPILIDTAFNAGFFLSVAGTINWTVPIPNAGIFLGVHFFTQTFSFDTVNALGGVTSDGATALIGNS
jgi:PKD repeat protein